MKPDIEEVDNNHMGNFYIAEENILICAFSTSDALKKEIRRITLKYSKRGWDLISISTQGPFIKLKFKYS